MAFSIGQLVGHLTIDNRLWKRGLDEAKNAVANTMKAAAAAAAIGVGAMTAGAAYTLKAGFDRLSSIETAQQKLLGLGHTADTVATVMDNSLQAVRGTAFGLGEAASFAASAVASGIKPGSDLQSMIALIADTATIAGTSMQDMGLIFNEVAASGVMHADTIRQLSSRGIPVIQFLAQTYGKTTAEIYEMTRRNEISFDMLRTAMERGLGGAAASSGNTFSGAFKNVQAALSRIGAGLMDGIFPQLAPSLQRVTKMLEPLEDRAKSVGDELGRMLNSVGGIDGLVDRIGAAVFSVMPALRALIAWGRDQMPTVMRVLRDLGDVARNVFGWIGQYLPLVLGAIGAVVAFLLDSLPPASVVTRALGDAFSYLASFARAVAPAIETIGRGALLILGDTFRWLTTDIIPAVLTLLYQFANWFATQIPTIRGLWAGFGEVISYALRWLITMLPFVYDFLGQLGSYLLANWPNIMGVIIQVGGLLGVVISSLIQALPLLFPILSALGGVIVSVINAATPVVLMFTQALLDGLQWLSVNLPPLLGQVQNFFNGIAGEFAKGSGGFGAFGEAAQGVIGWIMSKLPEFQALLGRVWTFVGEALRGMGQFWEENKNWIGPVIQFIGDILVDSIIGAIDGIMKFLSGLGQVFWGIVNLVKALISGDWAGAWDALKQIAGGAIEAVTGAIQAWWNLGIVNVFRKGIGKVLSMFKGDLWGSIAKLGRDGLGNLMKVVETMNKNLLGWVKGIGESFLGMGKSIVEWFKAIPGAIYEFGRSAIAKFVQGLIDRFPLVGEAIRRLGEMLGVGVSVDSPAGEAIRTGNGSGGSGTTQYITQNNPVAATDSEMTDSALAYAALGGNA